VIIRALDAPLILNFNSFLYSTEEVSINVYIVNVIKDSRRFVEVVLLPLSRHHQVHGF